MQIISNSALSLDGRLALAHDHFVPLGSRADKRVMSELRNRADAVLVGGNSFRTTPLPLLPKPEMLEEALRPLPYWNVVVSRKMDFVLSDSYLNERRILPLFLTSPFTKALSPKGRGGKVVEVISCPHGDPTPTWIVETLTAKGVKTLLIEAGGDLIYQFLRADLIDDMYITLCPKIIGVRGAPALADGAGFGEMVFKKANLCESRVVEDEVFLHYTLRGAKRST